MKNYTQRIKTSHGEFVIHYRGEKIKEEEVIDLLQRIEDRYREHFDAEDNEPLP